MPINKVSEKLIKFTEDFLRDDSCFQMMVEELEKEQREFFSRHREDIIKLVTNKEREAALTYGEPIYPLWKIKEEKLEEQIDDVGWYLVERFNLIRKMK